MTLAVHSPAGAAAPAAEIDSETQETEGIVPDTPEALESAAEEQTPPEETEEVEHGRIDERWLFEVDGVTALLQHQKTGRG